MNPAMASGDFGGYGSRLSFGNKAGRDLLEDREELKERLTRLEDRCTNLQSQVTGQQREITDLQHHVNVLTLSSKGYMKIRGQVIEVYRRDVLSAVDSSGLTKISQGNIAAHEGDAISDAQLYISGRRFDENVLVMAYPQGR
jgi:transposase